MRAFFFSAIPVPVRQPPKIQALMSENEKKRKQAAIEKTLRIKRAMGLIPDEGAEAQQTSRSRENGQMSARSAGTGAGILKTVRAHGLDQNLHDSEVFDFPCSSLVQARGTPRSGRPGAEAAGLPGSIPEELAERHRGQPRRGVCARKPVQMGSPAGW